MWSSTNDVLPFVFMLVVTCVDMTVLTIIKVAMNDGMESIVYIVYHNALGTLILLPFFIVHIFRNAGRPQLNFYLLFRFFILGLLGMCLFQILLCVGINYSSPTLGSAISNLIPGNTFLLAVVFRMEKVDIRSSSSVAKLFGTIIAILGATVSTLYQGPVIFHILSSPYPPNQLVLLQPSDWVFGGVILVLAAIVGSIWIVLQSATVRKYPDQQTVVFYYSLFGTISCIALSPFLKPNPNAWVLRPGTAMSAIVSGAVYSIALRSTVVTWCLEKKGPVFVAMFNPISIVIAVTMGVTFIGDSLHLGSAIGGMIIATGFYTVMWGLAKETNKSPVVMQDDLDVADEPRSSDLTTPLSIS